MKNIMEELNKFDNLCSDVYFDNRTFVLGMMGDGYSISFPVEPEDIEINYDNNEIVFNGCKGRMEMALDIDMIDDLVINKDSYEEMVRIFAKGNETVLTAI